MGSKQPGGGKGREGKAGDFEVLDIRGTANDTMSWFQRFAKDISKAPVAKQAAVGGISGWVVGYLSMKVGKVAATVVGGSLIVMQLAAHQGYIKIDWKRVNKDLESHAKILSKEVESRLKPGMADEDTFSRQLDTTLNKAARRVENFENKADTWLNRKLSSGRKFYRKYVLGKPSEITVEELYAIHVYLLAFTACTMLGRALGRVL